MELKSFFLDTYAIYEMLKGNPRYEKYKEDVRIATSKLNLMEIYYIIYNENGKEIADIAFDLYLNFCVEIDDNTIKEAMILKHRYKKRKLSYVDCIGYMVALKNGVNFLTGDKQFQDLPNVEFVK